jgi:hypothetical protein
MAEQTGDPPFNIGPDGRKVVDLLRAEEKRLMEGLLNLPGKNATSKRFYQSDYAQRLRQVQDRLKALKVETAKLTGSAIRSAYAKGIRDAERGTAGGFSGGTGTGSNSGPIRGSMNLIDTKRAEVLVGDAVADVQKGVDAMGKKYEKTVRDAHAIGLNNKTLNELLAKGTISGQTGRVHREVRDLIDKIADKKTGMVTIPTRSGGTMTMDARTYADLILQTKGAEAANIATRERLASKGINYVKIIGSDSANFCTAFVNKAYYTGPGADPLGLYPHINELPRGGAPFHPRCTKRYVAFIPKLASPAELEKAKPNDETKRLHGVGRDEAQQRYATRKRSATPAAKDPLSGIKFGVERLADKAIADRALRRVADAKVALPRVVRDATHQEDKANRAGIAAMHVKTGDILLFKDFSARSDPERQRKMAESNWLSSADPDHVIFHECGHFAHREADPEAFGKMLRSPALGKIQKAVAGRVSRYATSAKYEFVAETFAGLMAGKRYDSDVMNLYASLGGPLPKTLMESK